MSILCSRAHIIIPRRYLVYTPFALACLIHKFFAVLDTTQKHTMSPHDEVTIMNVPTKDVERPEKSAPSDEDSQVDTKAQAGIQAIEAVTLSWTKKALIFAYTVMW
jgi:hypothetical protein